MTRRWLVSCGSLAISTTLGMAAWGQSPTLSERFQQLRSGWGGGDAQEEATPEVPETSAGERRSMLPSVDPRSLLPEGFFGRSSPESTPQASRPTSPRQSAASRTMPKPSVAAAIRMGSQSRVGSASSDATPTELEATSTPPNGATAHQPSATSNARNLAPITPVLTDERPSRTTAAPPARRSPEQRTPPNFNSDALINELAGSFPPPASPEPTQSIAEGEPIVADDFAAGLEREAAILGRAAPPPSNAPATTAPTASSPAPRTEITLRPSGSSPRTARSSTGRPGSTSDDRYAQPSFPSVGGLIGRKIESEATPTLSDSAAPDADASVIVSDDAAAKAFRSGSPTHQAAPRSTSASPFLPHNTASSKPSSDSFRRESFATPTAVTPNETGVLATNQAPAISSDIRGPHQITVGREATFELRLKNTGSSAASELVATVRVPSWADVVSTTTTDGIVRQSDGSEPSNALQWHIPALAASDGELLTLRLIPRASRPLELGVTWTHAPVDARTVVEVQEPKLRMSVSGPDEVLYGKPHVYRLTISNPGTGTAENVRIDLLPPGGGRESVSSHSLGNLAAGESKSVEVELTAREAGKLHVEAVASADGGLTSEANKELFCRKPELEVDWRGPETQFAGTPATYFFRVRNPGTAAADNVAVRVAMPNGAEFVSASEGYRHNANAGEVLWHVGSLGPGDDCYMELRCVVHTPGENQIRVAAATAAGDLSDNKLAATKVVALADLKLDVADPAGPVLVGDEAIYEIRVTNRGASAAEEVNVVGLFSAGLEPETVEGSAYTATDGRVSFRTIRKLPAGQNVVLQIKAKATQPGTHVFRAEVLCRDLEIKLAAEETTRFYDNQLMHESAAAASTVIGSREANLVR